MHRCALVFAAYAGPSAGHAPTLKGWGGPPTQKEGEYGYVFRLSGRDQSIRGNRRGGDSHHRWVHVVAGPERIDGPVARVFDPVMRRRGRRTLQQGVQGHYRRRSAGQRGVQLPDRGSRPQAGWLSPIPAALARSPHRR